MKQFIFFICLVCLSASSSAQRKGFNAGLLGGFGTASLRNSSMDDILNTELSSKRHFFIHGNGGYMFNNHVGLFTGLGYGLYQWQIYGEELGFSVKINQTQRYFEVPIYFHFITSKPRKPGLFANVGAKVGFMTSAKARITTTEAFEPETISVDNEEVFESTPVMFHIVIGASFPVSPGTELTVGLSSDHALGDNFDQGHMEGKLSSRALCIGLLVNLHR